MTVQNNTKYFDDIFIGDRSSKKLRTGIIIFSILLHITIIYLVYEADVKKSLIRKPKTITLVKIAPLMVSVPHEKIAKINKKARFQKSGIPSSNNESLKVKVRKKLEKQSLVNFNIEKFSLGVSGERRLFFSSPKKKLNDFQIMMERKKQVSNLIFKNYLKINPPTLLPGDIHKYSYKVGEDNLINYGGMGFEKRKGFDIFPWAQKTLAKIKRFWKIPYSLNPGIKGEVGVSVVFNKGGDIKSLNVNHSASTQVFNQAAINAFNLGKPFDPLPNEILENKLKSYFVFNYSPSIELKEEKNNMKLGAIININPFIKSIGLVKDKSFNEKKLPENLYLGIESTEKVFYKVLYGEKILNGGELNRGFNFVQISSENIFSRNYTYEFYIEIMNNGQKYRNKFFVDIRRILPGNSGGIEKKIINKGYGIAMFLENQLIAYHQKPIFHVPLTRKEMALKKRQIDMSGSPDPWDVTGEKKLRRLSAPIMGLVFLGYKKLIKPMIRKIRERKIIKKVDTYKLLSGTFLKKNIEGLMQPIEITLALRGK